MPWRALETAAAILAAALATAVLVFLAARGTAEQRRQHDAAIVLAGGDPARGAAAITAIGCGACHRIPGIVGASGRIAPPLDDMSARLFIAGILPNTPANLVRWVQEPQRVLPGNGMPDLGLSEQQARDITAYLLLLR